MRTVLRWLPIVVGLLLIAGFLRLGQWQSERARFKDALFAQFDSASVRDAIPLATLAPGAGEAYQPVIATGRWLGDTRIHLENQVVDGRAGVHVFAPLETAAGVVHLVNLGWLPMAADRSLPPLPPLPQAAGLPALLAPPPAVGVRLGELGLDAQETPFRVPWIDLDALAARLNLTLAPQILLATAPSERFRREWRPATMSADKHRAYAFQWNALATAVALFTVWGLWRLLGPGVSARTARRPD